MSAVQSISALRVSRQLRTNLPASNLLHHRHHPLAGHLFVFANRRATQIKVLYFDRSGWCLWGKRLEAGRFVRNWRDACSGEID